jgi:hypothetical protein
MLFARDTPDEPNQNNSVIEIDPQHHDTILVRTQACLFISWGAGLSWKRDRLPGCRTPAWR